MTLPPGVLISYRVDNDTELVRLSTVAKGIEGHKQKSGLNTEQDTALVQKSLALEEAWRNPDLPFDPSSAPAAPAAAKTSTNDITVKPASQPTRELEPEPELEQRAGLPISTKVEKLPATGVYLL